MEEFIGFDSIIKGFSKRAKNNNISHAHLIVGPDGIGKSIIARIFSLMILEKEQDKDYVDIVNYKPKKASFGVDEIRDVIDEVNKKPYEGNKKVVIIHEGSKLTVQAQNALLKTIEEPPEGVFIIILSESLESMLDTVKSRSQIYKLTPLNKQEMEKFLRKINMDGSDKATAAISYAEGIPGKALRLLKDEDLQNLRSVILNMLKDLGSGKNIVLEYEEKFSKYKNNKEEVLNLITLFVRDIMINKEIKDDGAIINIDKKSEIREVTNLLSYKKLNSIIKQVNKARINLNNNVSYSMVISLMLIGFWED